MKLKEFNKDDTTSSAALKKIDTFTVYHGNVVDTPKLGELNVLPNAAIGVDSDGTIKFVAENCSDPYYEATKHDPSLSEDKIRVVSILNDPYKFFFPGFIDTHIHAPQYPNCGLGTDLQLLEWLTEITFPLEASLTDLTKAETIYSKVIKKTLENGTTCASYFATIDPDATNVLTDLVYKYGQRGFIGRVCMDSNSPSYYIETLEDAKVSTQKVINHINSKDPLNEIVKPILTPRFAPSCSSELLEYLGKVSSSQNLPIQTHIDENHNEIEWVKNLFPNSSSYADVYHTHNLLKSTTILAHAIHLTEDEIELIKHQKCSISHCPISNSAITSGEAKVSQLIGRGIPVSLGTDVSGGFSPSILTTARQALLVSRHLSMKTNMDSDKLTINEVLYLATMGGARAVSMENKLGSFAVGKKWDSQLIDLDCCNSPIDLFDWQNPKDERLGAFSKKKFVDLIAKWVLNGDDRNTRKVWCNGRIVIDKSDY